MRSQYDKFPTGGSDNWDNDNAGAILTAEFFGAAAPAGGLMKWWDGAMFLPKTLKVWNGSTFSTGALKHWNGTDWQLSNA